MNTLPPATSPPALVDVDDAYTAELRAWRERRSLSKRALAGLMAYDRSYVVQIENGTMPPTEAFTRRAEEVLVCGGSLWMRWETWHRIHCRAGSGRARRPGAATPASASRLHELVEQLEGLVERLSSQLAGNGTASGTSSGTDDAGLSGPAESPRPAGTPLQVPLRGTCNRGHRRRVVTIRRTDRPC